MMWHFSSQFVMADASDSLPGFIWIIGAAIVVIGLLGFGLGDVRRFSFQRVWAIGGVSYRESVRRRVLWIIPLAVVGVIVVAQLQKVDDEQDAVREITKFCLFAAGLVVVLTTIILASTNLPREIDNRVIYTIVTKPTTRLELIAGKIVGFARVSGLILIIMGVFSYAYLRVENWRGVREVNARLANDPLLSALDRNMLEHYRDAGLLTAKEYAQPSRVEVMASIPENGDPVRCINGDSQEEFLFPFKVNKSRLFSDAANPGEASPATGIGKTGLLIGLRVKWHRYGPQESDPAKRTVDSEAAYIVFNILNSEQNTIILGGAMYEPRIPQAKDGHPGHLQLPARNTMDQPGAISDSEVIWVYVPPAQAALIYAQPTIYLHLIGESSHVQYYADGTSAFMAVSPPPPPGYYAPPLSSVMPAAADEIVPDLGADGKPAPPLVQGRPASRGGQELAGKPSTDEHAAFAVLHFRDTNLGQADLSRAVSVEFRVGVDRGGDITEENDSLTDVTLWVRPADGKPTNNEKVDLKLDNKLTVYASLDPADMASGDFDVILRCNTPGHVLGVEAAALSLVTGQQTFAWNLAKSLFIMWMLTVLVVSLAIFSSTFLSWPIAVVLTVVLLMGHWCVMQVADSNDKTLGRTMATDWGITDPSKAEALASSVNTLSGSLQWIGALLPDIDRFAAIDDIDRGAVVSRLNVAGAAGILIGFGLPSAVLAYLILKKKEVAP